MFSWHTLDFDILLDHNSESFHVFFHIFGRASLWGKGENVIFEPTSLLTTTINEKKWILALVNLWDTLN